jgi:Fur family ferric uptake transcriptional regulator
MAYMTNQKKQILDLLITHKDHHYTVDEIVQSLSDGDKKPGKSTVYRQISSLLEDGVIRRFEAAGADSFVYQYAAGVGCEHHFHLKCSRCGNLLHMECDKLHEVRRHILEDHGFLIGGNSVIYGVCAACREGENA